jgi:hypothetical protein
MLPFCIILILVLMLSILAVVVAILLQGCLFEFLQKACAIVHRAAP